MLALEEAVQRILAELRPLATETAPLREAAGRFLAEPFVAPHDLPLFDNSAMDGYAVRAEDVASVPVSLRVIGSVPAGAGLGPALERGTCVRIFTGSPLPQGADAVVMQEDTELRDDVVVVKDSVRPWENIRLRGQDLKRGTEVIAAGERLIAGKTGLLAALGAQSVKVFEKPSVALLATGNELLEPGHPLAPGKIYESNRVTLAALLASIGIQATSQPLVRDSLSETTDALRTALASNHVIITTGGVSVGEYDLVKAAFEKLGGEMTFWRVAVKPGKPFAFGRIGEKFFFGLPGNPVSAAVTFLLLVRPALLKLQGATAFDLPSQPGVLREALTNRGDRRHFMSVRVDRDGGVFPVGLQASHAIAGFARAEGLVDLPPKTTLNAGETVRVLRWEI
jgi:molybdopterin molybdotransferase